MIGTIELARRIEAAETRLSLALAEVSRAHHDPNAFALRIGSGAAVYSGPGAPMTKVIGVGIAEPIEDADIDRVEAAYAPTGERPGWEIATLGDLASIRRLEARGYRLQRVEMVLGRDLSRPTLIDPPPSDIRVARASEEEWAQVAVPGFAAAETVDGREAPAEQYDESTLERVVQQFAGVPDVRHFVGYVNGVPAGVASSRVDAGILQLCGATTLPAHRRRGVQSALLGARLADARGEACDLSVVTVEPGSRSQMNVQRRLFEPLYSRLVFALDA